MIFFMQKVILTVDLIGSIAIYLVVNKYVKESP